MAENSKQPLNHIYQARVIRMDELKTRLGLSKTTIYEMIKTGEFDPGFLIGKRARGWLSSTVDEWLESKQNGGAA